MSQASSNESSPPATQGPTLSLSVELTIQLDFSVEEQTKKKGKTTTKTVKKSKNKETTFSLTETKENYLSFLSTLASVHGHEKYAPVIENRRFAFKANIPPSKAKKDAVDIETYEEYRNLVAKVLEFKPQKLSITYHLDNVKTAHKRAENADDTHDTDEESGDETKAAKSTMERELARLRGLLEAEHKNETGGWTFTNEDGFKTPLTNSMMMEWSRAMYDGKASVRQPPNTIVFDPRTRRRSLFEKPEAAVGDSSALEHVSSIIGSICQLAGTNLQPLAQPAQAVQPSKQVQAPASPAKNTPSKLSRFLVHAEETLGVTGASSLLSSFEDKGLGPDVLPHISNDEIAALGVKSGDVVRLKRGAEDWWKSPEAKRPKGSQPGSDGVAEKYDIRYEKQYHAGGSMSVFGSHLIPGDLPPNSDYKWAYYNQVTKRVEAVPDGFIPVLDPQYHDDKEDWA